MTSRMEPLVMNVTIIQYLLLLALVILPADSNVESSNMASLESEIGYLSFRHRESGECSRRRNGFTEVNSTYIRTVQHLQSLLHGLCNSNRETLYSGALCRRQRDRF